MDQTTPEDQILLGDFRKRCSNPSLQCHYHLLFGGYRRKRIENRAVNLRNITGNWHIPTGQNACK